MAGAIPRVCSERLAPFFFQPQSTKWMHRSVQIVFRRFCSDSKSHGALVGAPEPSFYKGHPDYHHWEESFKDSLKWKPSPKFFENQEKTLMKDLIAEVRKLNERFEQILPLLKSSKP